MLPCLIWGEVHGIFSGFLGLGFCRKIIRTKINKANKNQANIIAYSIFSRINRWRQLRLIIYPLFILLPHYLHQLPFLTLSHPECTAPPRARWTCMFILATSTTYPTPNTLGRGFFICWMLLFRKRIWRYFLDPTTSVLPGLVLHCKFLIPPIIPYFPPFTYIFCTFCSSLLPISCLYVQLCPHHPWIPHQIPPTPFTYLDKMAINTRVCKKNQRKICKNPIQILILISIWNSIPIQCRCIPYNISHDPDPDPDPDPYHVPYIRHIQPRCGWLSKSMTRPQCW